MVVIVMGFDHQQQQHLPIPISLYIRFVTQRRENRMSCLTSPHLQFGLTAAGPLHIHLSGVIVTSRSADLTSQISRTSQVLFSNRLHIEGTPQVRCLLPYALPCLPRTQYLRLYTPFTWLRIMLVLGENMFWGVCAPMLVTEHRISPQGRAVGVRMLQ
jgi:hypothetical protein